MHQRRVVLKSELKHPGGYVSCGDAEVVKGGGQIVSPVKGVKRICFLLLGTGLGYIN